MKTKAVRVEVYSWQGYSVGATHYYVDLHSWDINDRRSVRRLQRRLTTHDAAKINDKLRHEYAPDYYELYKVEPGEKDYRYDTAEQALDEALKQWRTIFPDAECLVDYKDPRKVYATT